MGRAGSPADPTSSSTWVFSHVCSAGWSWRSSPPLMRSEPYSSSASTPLSPMREPSPPIWRPCATANGWSTANAPSGDLDGEAEFVTGGKMVDPKVTAPGQTRGTGIEGGVSHHLTKGDVITIPAKTPHQWKDTSKTGSVGYYAVNFDSN